MNEEQKYNEAAKYRRYRESRGVNDPVYLMEIEDGVYHGLEKGYDYAVQEIYKWLEDNIKDNLGILACGAVSVNFAPLLEKYKETFNKDKLLKL